MAKRRRNGFDDSWKSLSRASCTRTSFQIYVTAAQLLALVVLYNRKHDRNYRLSSECSTRLPESKNYNRLQQKGLIVLVPRSTASYREPGATEDTQWELTACGEKVIEYYLADGTLTSDSRRRR